MNRVFKTSSNDLDFVASQLRSQLVVLHSVLDSIERTNMAHNSFVLESLRNVEQSVRGLRKAITVN